MTVAGQLLLARRGKIPSSKWQGDNKNVKGSVSDDESAGSSLGWSVAGGGANITLCAGAVPLSLSLAAALPLVKCTVCTANFPSGETMI